ncbi:NAD(P)H-hydrate dehydratase [Stenotrophomonas sp. C3(2023)]|uniref:NAD(P)H-hydrate dehydratase n=1 Tax=Stenotrophomonas sp. C3(2023) TaxID=3080277 RepID=UPI00293C8A26|nr:NAD(P)H-hydrate dehydratase [Stenotrophomonas sp. C3(2023)]MDV3468254.1 NAD(P)H-hydrate dehydratase [Stenotrophomonas sp. C3(2023)]
MPELSDLFDSAAARTLDAQTSALHGDDGWRLMSAAGLAAWRYLLQYWPRAQRICVVVGSGNNGGDGLVLASHALRAGRQVTVLGAPGWTPATSLAQRAAEELLAAGGSVQQRAHDLPGADLVVDALLGLGLQQAPRPAAQRLIEAINVHPAPVLALDVPSGVDADRGSIAGAAVRAQRTLQFIVRHRGLHTGAALEHGGVLDLAPLELPAAAWQGVQAAARHWQAERLAAHLPARRRNAHKGDSGHVLCVGGNHGSGGAVLLAAEATLRSGAGLTSLATRAAHVTAALVRVPEAMVHALDDAPSLQPLLARATVLAIGPGLGQDAWAHTLWQQARDSGLPLVVDADALNLLAAAPLPLPGAILTPHPGEAARLLGCSTAQVQGDRFGAAAALAERYNAVVVLKGAGSVVAGPGRTCAVIDAGNPGMAVGGMGDLLTGIIAALRAQHLEAFDAAACGALLHGLAGDDAAHGGARGLLPTDLLAPLRRRCNPDLHHA